MSLLDAIFYVSFKVLWIPTEKHPHSYYENNEKFDILTVNRRISHRV